MAGNKQSGVAVSLKSSSKKDYFPKYRPTIVYCLAISNQDTEIIPAEKSFSHPHLGTMFIIPNV